MSQTPTHPALEELAKVLPQSTVDAVVTKLMSMDPVKAQERLDQMAVGLPQMHPRHVELVIKYWLKPHISPTGCPWAWAPPMTDSQEEGWLAYEIYQLYTGPRYSGKSFMACHRILKHMYEEENSSVLVLGINIAQFKDGIWDDLVSKILPLWQKPWPVGIGLQATPVKEQDKLAVFSILNCQKKWVDVTLRAIEKEEHLSKKLKSSKYSAILADELSDREGPSPEEMFPTDKQTTPKSPGFFTKLQDQLRLEGCKFKLYLGCCNPDPKLGQRNWVWQWFLNPRRMADIEAKIPGSSKRYRVIEMPATDNIFAEGSELQRYKESYIGDPVAYAAYVEGKWIVADAGSSLFPTFKEELHIVGNLDLEEPEILSPDWRQNEIFVGWDPGESNHAAVFSQKVVYPEKSMWLTFDEHVVISGRDPDNTLNSLSDEVVVLMDFWDDYRMERIKQYNQQNPNQQIPVQPYHYIHISDDTALTKKMSATGGPVSSYIQERSKGRINLLPVRKSTNFQAQRVICLRSIIGRNQYRVSAKCTHVINMIRPGGLKWIQATLASPIAKIDRTGPHIHVFDALTYPIIQNDIIDFSFSNTIKHRKMGKVTISMK